MENKQVDISLKLERIGFGKFQIVALAILCLRYFSYSSTTSLVAILEPYLRCHWSLSYMNAAWIVLPEAITKIIGSILLGRLSDIYGRRKILILASVANSYLALLYSLSSSVLLLSIIRGSIGLVSSSTLIIFTYTMEILPLSERKYMSLFELAFCLGCGYGIVVAGVTLKYLNWRWFDTFAETIPIAFSTFLVFYLPESPRYLSAAGKREEAEKSLERIAEMNGCEKGYFPLGEACADVEYPEEGAKRNLEPECQLSRRELAERIALLSLLQFYGDVVSGTMRYGSMQFGENSDVLGCGQCFQNLTYKYRWSVETAVLLSVVASYWLLNNVTRKLSLKILVVYLAACLVPFYWPLRGWPLLISLAFTVLGSSTLNNVLLVYRAELIPTSSRTFGCGLSDAFGQFGIMFGQIIALYLYHVSIPLSLGLVHGLTALCIVAVFTALIETKYDFLT